MESGTEQLLGSRYRLPSPGTRADGPVCGPGFDTYSEQPVMLYEVLLPDFVDAEFLGNDPLTPLPGAAQGADGADAVAEQATEAVRAAMRLPDHPRLEQVFDVLVADGSLWVVSERVEARPLSAVLAEGPLGAFRAAEIGADVLDGMRVLHRSGWAHGNVTVRTVLICDDGRAILTGLATGLAQDTLCGYTRVPAPTDTGDDAVEPRAPRPVPDAAVTPRIDAPRSPANAATSRPLAGMAAEALRADALRHTVRAAPASPSPPTAPTPTPAPGTASVRGPATAVAAERARQARIAAIGAVTDRWAPEQAAPIGTTWLLYPPVSPATDLWALGALLLRIVQGHAPYPEQDVAELVKSVCTEPPVFDAHYGPLRPVIESLLRPDPAERCDGEELAIWLDSLLRTAPEPAPPSEPADPVPAARLLPVLRRRGELVLIQRTPAAQAPGRHRKSHPPRWLGRIVLPAVIAALSAITVYATQTGTGQGHPRPSTASSAPPSRAAGQSPPLPRSSASRVPGTSSSEAPGVPAGFSRQQDAAGFQLIVPTGWIRQPVTPSRQIRYAHGEFTLLVVAGRDRAPGQGDDPLAYQAGEPELADCRSDPRATATGVQQITIGANQPVAVAQYTCAGAEGAAQYIRNRVTIVDGRFHILLVTGPAAQRDRVSAAFDQAARSYRSAR
ncbi:hypothetical protein ACGFW5_01210 [Streptomyces sp. NPDC048416]|uniref:hypothetical protein n=1 Tax=Streptomyces sp. NPDC048416 TaxID=3365546 RepID=UPI003719576E